MTTRQEKIITETTERIAAIKKKVNSTLPSSSSWMFYEVVKRYLDTYDWFLKMVAENLNLIEQLSAYEDKIKMLYAEVEKLKNNAAQISH